MKSAILLGLMLFAQPILYAQAQSTWTCTDTLNGGTRNCCPTSGICQDSSCTVFGFPNSARANCHTKGSNPNCPDSYCNWKVSNCPTSDTTGNHCYGTVACKPGKSGCYGEGLLCLEDGNSDNFKVCGDTCNKDKDCPTNSTCDKNRGSGTCTDPLSETSVSPTNQCCTAETSQQCQNLANNYPAATYKTADIQSYDAATMKDRLAAYGCSQPDPTCNQMVCTMTVPDSVLTQLNANSCG